ncbi:MAG TPA: rhomboid family intramembrane serine protease [Thermoanaerobaculia bacterium]|nr:rhomboid family intramembrane serine protease [Thermoanaerobaculia bacterium]
MNERFKRMPATVTIIVAILAGFGVEFYTGALQDPRKLTYLGAIWAPLILGEGEWWRLLSAMFLHGDVLHLLMNLIALFQLGSLYELMFGSRRFTIIYFVTGLVASLTSMIITGGPSVGASGAVFGIMGAFIFSIRRSPRWRHERAARGIVSQLIFWVVANIAIAMKVPQIDLAAHMGGLVAGLVIGMVWPHRVPPPPPTQMVIDVQPYDD